MDEKKIDTGVSNGLPVDGERLRKFTVELQKYKAGKASVESRAIAAENWWKLRNQAEIRKQTQGLTGFEAKSGWLHNVIVAKHADATEAFPEPNILAREPGDVEEAGMLSKIIPVVLETNKFEEVYSDNQWQKLKTGTGIYKVYWDADKLNGLGDIAIKRVNILNIFWEPGVTDIQDSKYVFHTALVDKDTLEGMYPQLKDKLKTTAFTPAKFQTDDAVSTENKAVVIDVYYKTFEDGKTALHYCKYVGDEILYSTENEEAMQNSAAAMETAAMMQQPTQTQPMPDAPVPDQQYTGEIATVGGMTRQKMQTEPGAGDIPAGIEAAGGTTLGMMPPMPGAGAMPTPPQPVHHGLYDHGLYPFVFDTLFPIEGSPCGYGFIDLCQNSQMQIDIMQTAFLKNTMVGAMPRYFQRMDGAINEEEFLNLDNPVVHVNGNLGEDSIRPIDYRALSGNYLDMRTSMINELRETSGNTEASNGVISSGVTAASAIAALQEASGKGSRDSSRSSYRAYSRIVNLCIELIRQFYDMPRQFRITGKLGAETFVRYSNENIKMQMEQSGNIMYARLPEFDIKVSPAKRSSYSRITQNEMALQFYRLGFFNPDMTDQALACCYMMDFDNKDTVMQMINYNGTMRQELAQLQQYALALTAKYEPDKVEGLATAFNGGQAPKPSGSSEDVKLQPDTEEDSRVQNTRAKSQSYSQPEG